VNEIRSAFLASARVCADVVRHPAVGQRWDSPSALEHFSVRGLAGHLVRATGSAEAYLDRPEPEAAPISSAEYYAAAVDDTDIESSLHVAVREKGEAEAAEGHPALVDKLDGLVERLHGRLETEPEGRLVSVFKDLVLRLDDYLVTRIVEQLVHCDDLAVSIAIDTPPAPAGAMELAFANLVDIARVRHGDLAVLRAFTRRERDSAEALRIF
jgi:Mycothiol maleylpyruvate isomerase N-terminal domain